MYKWDSGDYTTQSSNQQQWAQELISKIELIPKDMKLEGKKGLSGFIRSTWLPYTRRIPEDLRAEFIDSVVNKYLEAHLVDKNGIVHIGMIRLEVEAENCMNS